MFTPSQVSLIARHASDAGEGSGTGHTVYASNVMRRRYVVGGVAPALVFPIGEARHTIRAAVRRMLAQGVEHAQTLGMWEDAGSVYVDAGDMWYLLEHALEVARARGELAIYDREAGECIPVNAA